MRSRLLALTLVLCAAACRDDPPTAPVQDADSVRRQRSYVLPDGSIELTYQSDVDAFTDTIAPKNLSICCSVTDLTPLKVLKSVGGNLSISNTRLTNINGLDSLRSIGGSLSIQQNRALTNLDGLAGLTSVGGQLRIYRDSALVNVNGLAALTSVGALSITENRALADLDGLSGLKTLRGGAAAQLEIQRNATLGSIDGISHLTYTASSPLFVTIAYNPLLADLDGLSGLTSVHLLTVRSNASLRDISGLSGIRGAARVVEVVQSGALASLHGLEGLTSLYSLNISSNPVLRDLDALAGLDSIGGSVTIGGNPVLQNIDGLSGVTEFAYEDSYPGVARIAVTWNNALTSVDGFANVTSLHGGGLWLNQNPALTNINGLAKIAGPLYDLEITGSPLLSNIDALSGVTVVNGELIIHDNTALASINGLARISGPIPNSVTITGNDALANIDALAGVTSIDGGLDVGGKSLVSIDGLRQLTSVSGRLRITNTDLLPNLDGLLSLISAPWIEIADNRALADIDGLSNVRGALLQFLIWKNPTLTNINGLAGVSSVSRSVSIYDNSALANVDGLRSLTSVGWNLVIDSNPALSNLNGLAQLTSVGRLADQFAGDLAIARNHTLRECSTGLYRLLAGNGVKRYVTIENNATAGGCNSKEEILANPPQNTPPLANAGGPYAGFQGSPIMFSGAGSSDPEHQPLTYSWTFGDGSQGTGMSSSHAYALNAAYLVCLTVTDAGGLTATQCTTARISAPPPDNLPPVADAGGPYVGNEGSALTFSGTRSSDPESKPLAYSWTFGDGSQGTGVSTSHVYGDNAIYTVCLTVTDAGGLTSTQCTTANVSNVAPAVGPLTAPLEPVRVGTSVLVGATFTDPGTLDAHTATLDWGDQIIDAVRPVTNTVSGAHTYTSPGVYAIQLTVTDDDGGSGLSVFRYVVVFDPSAGFVTGGGWIDSRAGAYLPDPSASGKVTFGFVSKYDSRGANKPTGNTEFQFKTGDLNFRSSDYDWLVVSQGGGNAQFKGRGTINGAGDYQFMLWAGDGNPDTFRIKIWREAGGSAESVVYDNGYDQALGGGSIVIHP